MKRKFFRLIAIFLVISVLSSIVSTSAMAANNACTPTIYSIKQLSSKEFSFKVSSDLKNQIEYSVYNASDVKINGDFIRANNPILKGTAQPNSTVKCKVGAAGKYYVLVKTKVFQTTNPEVYKVSVSLQETEYSKWVKWDKKTINNYKLKKAAINITSGVVVAFLTWATCGADLLPALVAGGGTAVISSALDYVNNSSVFTCSNVPTFPAENWKWRFRYEPDKKKEGFNIYLEVKDPTGKDAYCNNEKIGYIKTAW